MNTAVDDPFAVFEHPGYLAGATAEAVGHSPKCDQCARRTATTVAFHVGRRVDATNVCDDCFELLMLDGEWEPTAVAR